MKRMKLVSEADYQKLLKLNSSSNSTPSEIRSDDSEKSHLSNLIATKRQVLESDMPDDIKTIIYQDLIRRIVKKKNLVKGKPVLVKNITTPLATTTTTTTNQKTEKEVAKSTAPPPSTKQEVQYADILNQLHSGGRTKKILDFLLQNNIKWNSELEVTIDNQRVPHSNIVDVVNTLNSSGDLGVRGINEIKEHLASSSTPKNSKFFKQTFFKPTPPLVTRSKSSKLKTTWETY